MMTIHDKKLFQTMTYYSGPDLGKKLDEAGGEVKHFPAPPKKSPPHGAGIFWMGRRFLILIC